MSANDVSPRILMVVGLMTALMCVSAFVRIPVPPVAITLQSVVVLLSGLVLGPQLGPLAQGIYLALGLIGLPVFSQGGGLGYIFQPSFGYLLGFVPAAWFIGHGVHGLKTASTKRLLILAIGAHLLIYAIGLPYLYLALRYFMGTPVEFLPLVYSGCLLFLPGDFLKSAFFVVIAKRLTNNHTLTTFRESC